MDENKFVELQYTALREEILDTEKRNFQVLGFAIVSLPAAAVLANVYKVGALTFSLPVIVMVAALVYLGSNNGIVRCGRYIRLEIESKLTGVTGWETWLEKTPGVRTAERYVAVSVYLLFFVYYSTAVWMAWKYADTVLVPPAAVTALASYVALGIWFAIYYVREFRYSTSID